MHLNADGAQRAADAVAASALPLLDGKRDHCSPAPRLARRNRAWAT
jgi:hypothetical protein